MAEDNTFLNADNIYEEVEGESGKNLTLPDDQRSLMTSVEILLVLSKVVMLKQKMLERQMKEDGYKLTKTTEDFTTSPLSLEILKNLESL